MAGSRAGRARMRVEGGNTLIDADDELNVWQRGFQRGDDAARVLDVCLGGAFERRAGPGLCAVLDLEEEAEWRRCW